jgi:WD40 repeat protein
VIKKICEFNGHAAAIYSVDTDGNFLYSASGDKFVARWLVNEGIQDKFSIKADSVIYALKLVNKNKQLVFATNSGSIHVIDIENRCELKHFIQHKTAIFSLTENIYLNHIYCADSDGNLSVWNSQNWELLLFLPLLCGKIRDVIIDDDGKRIFLACQDETIRIFDTKNFNELANFKAHKESVNCLHLFPNKKQVIMSGGKDGHLKIWNYLTQKRILSIPAHNFAIYKILFLNNGNHFITASRDKTIKLWDSKTLHVVHKIVKKNGGHTHSVNDLCKLNEFEFASSGDDKKLILWKLYPEIQLENL